MAISLLSNKQPFSQLNTFEVPRAEHLIPATYSKVMTHEDEQFILAVTEEYFIRLIESKDGWYQQRK